ncbi:CGNR zinc finger domain-containing protein [Kitasatospora mediocidica]|uniref:CGNR zinc finger domain-containing protein n=1 Tax=Kitasatospora mediocidica TaxID=58352 RepID=UPI00068F7CF7|nr:CGNR zinc finger domain-containing protein [Kitasatospora mediocidica]
MPDDLRGTNPRGLYFVTDLANAIQEGGTVDAAELQDLLARHGGPPFVLTDDDARQLSEAAGQLIQVLQLHDEDRAAEAINALLARYPAEPRLTRLPGRPWSLHARAPEDADLTHWLLSTAALALGLWLSERGGCAWGRCAAPDCDRFFIDTGRRTPQRYCSPRCATRVRVAAHRTQRSSAGPAVPAGPVTSAAPAELPGSAAAASPGPDPVGVASPEDRA